MKSKITTKEITLAGVFLALASIIVILQIPIPPFLSFEFSLVIILLSRKYIGILLSMTISSIYPWFALLTPWITTNPIGIVSLILIAWLALWFDNLFVKGILWKKDILGALASTIIVTLIMTLINLVLIVPAYYGFDWSLVGEGNGWNYVETVLIIFLPFNFLKLTIIYVIELPLQYRLKKIHH